MKVKIDRVHAMEILDSRGNPTVYVSVYLKDGTRASAAVPSGASTGVHEAVELRDGDKNRYNGKGVLKAVKNVNTKINDLVRGMNVFDLQSIDDAMRIADGTKNKRRLGANAILGVSMACAHAGAKSAGLPLYKHLRALYGITDHKFTLPTPLLNVFNGGAHADNNLDMQEFIVIPHKFRTFSRKLQAGVETFHALQAILLKDGLNTNVGNEGGFAPNVGKTEDALEYLVKAIKKAKYKPGSQIGLGIDIAASEFYDARTGKYKLKTDKRTLTAEGMTDLIDEWTGKYPLMTIEDPLDQDAFEDWAMFTRKLSKKVLVIGDDFYVTNVERVEQGVKMQSSTAVLIKMNQIGTVSETMETIKYAKLKGQKIVVSHRSGETSDDTIADLAVAVNAEYIKTGAPSRSERLAKYNRLLQIEEELTV